MLWYYLNEGRTAGPVSEEQFASLQESGHIVAGTLVWRSGMPDWQPWAYVRQAASPADTAPEASDTETCCQCGRVQSQSNLLVFAEKAICASCKPFFFERLREGVLVLSTVVGEAYAGFWVRGIALGLDLVLVGLLTVGLSYAVPMPMPLPILLWMVYNVAMTTLFSATPGKLVLDLRVVSSDGRPMTLGLSIARMFSFFLSVLTVGLGFVLAAFDGQKRSLHDGMCETRVVRNALMPHKVL